MEDRSQSSYGDGLVESREPKGSLRLICELRSTLHTDRGLVTCQDALGSSQFLQGIYGVGCRGEESKVEEAVVCLRGHDAPTAHLARPLIIPNAGL